MTPKREGMCIASSSGTTARSNTTYMPDDAALITAKRSPASIPPEDESTDGSELPCAVAAAAFGSRVWLLEEEEMQSMPKMERSIDPILTQVSFSFDRARAGG